MRRRALLYSPVLLAVDAAAQQPPRAAPCELDPVAGMSAALCHFPGNR
jgi:hypothetical protein